MLAGAAGRLQMKDRRSIQRQTVQCDAPTFASIHTVRRYLRLASYPTWALLAEGGGGAHGVSMGISMGIGEASVAATEDGPFRGPQLLVLVPISEALAVDAPLGGRVRHRPGTTPRLPTTKHRRLLDSERGHLESNTGT